MAYGLRSRDTMKTLTGKHIILAVTGSIAAVETIKLAHALRRKGATVQAVMSKAATKIIHPDALTYACETETITRISGMVEHVRYCGDERKGDLFLIAPCTANTISKIAHAIDDTPVTTFATTALGSKMPVIIVPAMHHAMFRHSGLLENLETIKKWGVILVGPRIEEGKAKIANIDAIILECERALMGQPLIGTNILITSGRCEEPVDDVRVLTTRSSGKMGQELAKAAYRLGAQVTIVHRDRIDTVHNIHIDTAASMFHEVTKYLSENKTDIYISAAAISDYAPIKYKGKIPSGHNPSIQLTPLPKILDQAIRKAGVIVAFKIGTDSEEQAASMLSKGISLVAANTSETMGSETGSYTLIDTSGRDKISGTKEEIAHHILEKIIRSHILPPKTNTLPH